MAKYFTFIDDDPAKPGNYLGFIRPLDVPGMSQVLLRGSDPHIMTMSLKGLFLQAEQYGAGDELYASNRTSRLCTKL